MAGAARCACALRALDLELRLRLCINIEYIAPILRGAINLQYCQYLEGAGPGLVGVDSVSSDGRSIPGLRTLENRLKWAKIA